MFAPVSHDVTLIEPVAPSQIMPLGQILVRKRWLTSQQLGQALELQSSYALPLGQILIRCGYLTPQQIDAALKEQQWRSRGLWII